MGSPTSVMVTLCFDDGSNCFSAISDCFQRSVFAENIFNIYPQTICVYIYFNFFFTFTVQTQVIGPKVMKSVLGL